MRGLVLAMAHPLVAEPERQNELVREHRGPELDFCIIAGQAQSTVAALADSAFDRALKVDSPELVIAAGQARHHPEAQPVARSAARQKPHARIERGLQMSRTASRDAACIP